MLPLLALLLAQAPVLAGRAELRGGIQNDDPNVVLRVCPGGCGPNLQGSRGEAITFTRTSAWTCPNDDGSITQLATGVPCMPKGGGGTQYGLKVRPQVVNVLQQSSALGTAPWATSAGVVAAPTVTNNTTDVLAPDGSQTATKIVYPQVVGANAFSLVRQPFTATAAAWSAQTRFRTLSGTATIYLAYQITTLGTYHTATCSVTSSWATCKEANQTLTAVSWDAQIGVDLRDGAEATQAAQTVYAWAAQSETGAVASDYCPTGASSATCGPETSVMAAATPGLTASFCASVDATSLWGSAPSGEPIAWSIGSYSSANSVTLFYLGSGPEWFIDTFDNAGAEKAWGAPQSVTAGSAHHLRVCFDGAGHAPLVYVDGASLTVNLVGGVGTGVIAAPGLVNLGSSPNTTVRLTGAEGNFCLGNCSAGAAGIAACGACP